MSTTTIPTASSTACILTPAAREVLAMRLLHALATETNTLLDAPTSLGKSYTVASTPWRDYPEVTGEQPVIHLHETKKTRDAAASVSDEAGVKNTVLASGLELCPVAQDDENGLVPQVDGLSPSAWFKRAIDRGGYTFSEAHQMLDGKVGGLPCGDGDGCPSKSRWANIPRDEDGEPTYDIIHATHEFAHLEQLVENANLIFDEQPDYIDEVTGAHADFLRRSVNNLFKSHDETMGWNDLAHAARTQDEVRLEAYSEVLAGEAGEPKHGGHGYAHRSTDAITAALVAATPAVGGKRYVGRAQQTSVVLDTQETLRQLHHPPDLSDARCVIGLDAHPSPHLWRLNTVDDLALQAVLSPGQRQSWRRHERRLRVIQVGNARRQYTCGWRGSVAKGKAESIIGELRRHYGAAFRTAISSKASKADVRKLLSAAEVEDPEMMHFGNLKSRNDFEAETVGFVVGCIGPGDERILDYLGLCGLNAQPNRVHDGVGGRAYDREFVGPDADAAAEFLASVRETNLAQAVGRYARAPGTQDSGATVYVWSSAIPDSLTDEVVPGVISQVTTTKQNIEQFVRREKTVTKKQAAEQLGVSPTHSYNVLKELADQGVVEIWKGTGDYGADEYTYVSGAIQRSVDLGF